MSNERSKLSRERDILCYMGFGVLRALIISSRGDDLPDWAKRRAAELTQRYDEITEQLEAEA